VLILWRKKWFGKGHGWCEITSDKRGDCNREEGAYEWELTAGLRRD